MDMLSGLATVGSYMNSNARPTSQKVNTGRIKRTPTNGNNLYDNSRYRQNNLYVENVADASYKLAQNTEKTGVVPNFYNQMKEVDRRKKIAYNEYLKQKKDRQAYLKKQKDSQRKVEGFSGDNDSVFSDDKSNLSRRSRHSNSSLNGSVDLNNDHMAFFKKSNIMQDTRLHEKKYVSQGRQNETNGYLSQFEDLAFDNPTDPVSANSTGPRMGQYGNISKLEMERELALKGNYSNFVDDSDMTYGIVDPNKLTHNNMIPGYSSGTGKGYGPDSDATKKFNDYKQRKVELFSGSTKSVDYRPKTERRPLFNPQVGLTWIYGTPNFTDYMESRYIPSKERRNELVHQPVRITPGLNLGYNEISKEGFNDTFRVLPKTVDELRAANNPKISYEAKINHGKKGDRRPIIANMAKHKPTKFKEQDPRDMVKSLGYYRAPSIYGNYDAPSTNRQQTTKSWYGPIGFSKDEPRPESMMEKHRLPFRENFLSDTPRNITGVDQEKNTSNTGNSYYAKPTNRVTTEINGYVNPAAPPGWKQTYAWDSKTNIPDPTKRDTTQENGYVNPAAPGDWKQTYAWDSKTNIPDPTRRDTTQENGYVNPAAPGDWKQTYAWDTKTNVPEPTRRDTTQNNGYVNPAAPEWKQTYAWDNQTNIPDPTRRDTTQNNGYVNPAGPTDREKGGYQVEVQNTYAPTTIRQLTQNTAQIGQAAPNSREKGGYQVEVQNTYAPTTMRQLTQNTTQIGQAGPTDREKGGYQIEVQNTYAPTTMRQLTQNTTQIGQAGPTDREKGGYQIEVQNTYAPTTLRQLTQNTTQIGQAGPTDREKGGYQVAVQNTYAPPTMRQLTQNTTQIGQAGPTDRERGGYQVEAQNTIAPTTRRQLTQNTSQIGHAGPTDRERGGYQVAVQGTTAPTTLRQLTQNTAQLNPAAPLDRERGGYQVAVQGTTAPTTLRQLTQNKTQLNPAGPNEREKGGYQVAVQNTIAPTTLRQLTQHKTYQGPLLLHEGTKTRGRGDAENSLVNIGKDIVGTVRDNGAPTTCNYSIGKVYDFTSMQLCEPIEINREVYGSAPWQNPLGCIPTMFTTQPNQLPEINFHFDTCVTDCLKGNPLINNLVHKSVDY